jgi:hypothetical protein
VHVVRVITRGQSLRLRLLHAGRASVTDVGVIRSQVSIVLRAGGTLRLRAAVLA